MKEPNLYAYNVYQSRKQEEQMILLMSVFFLWLYRINFSDFDCEYF